MVYPVKWDLLNPCGPWPLEVDDFNKPASCSHKAGLLGAWSKQWIPAMWPLPTSFQPFVRLIPSGRTGNISAWSTSWARNALHFRWTQAASENTSPGIGWYWELILDQPPWNPLLLTWNSWDLNLCSSCSSCSPHPNMVFQRISWVSIHPHFSSGAPMGPFFGPAGVALQVMVRMASIQRCWTHFRPVLPAWCGRLVRVYTYIHIYIYNICIYTYIYIYPHLPGEGC